MSRLLQKWTLHFPDGQPAPGMTSDPAPKRVILYVVVPSQILATSVH